MCAGDRGGRGEAYVDEAELHAEITPHHEEEKNAR